MRAKRSVVEVEEQLEEVFGEKVIGSQIFVVYFIFLFYFLRCAWKKFWRGS